jgi:hypothetical protein
MADRGLLDLVVVTGHIADHGRAAQYRRAAELFGTLPAPVNVCPGNHDQHLAFSVGMARPTIGTSRAMEVGNWCFLFVEADHVFIWLHHPPEAPVGLTEDVA